MSPLDELTRRNVIRVALAYLAASWLLIQVVETLLPIFGWTEAGARILVVSLAIGFVPALVLSWLFQWTPDGLKWDSDAPTPVDVRRRNPLDRLVIVTLTLAVGYFATDKFLLDPVRDDRLAEEVAERARAEALIGSFGNRSIAVLPFENSSSDREQDYFAEGISEELLNVISTVPEIRVAARTSAFSFKGSGATASEIGDALNVAHVLEGSVRRSGDSVRVSARLVDAASDTQVWSATFNRGLADIFAIQDEIAREVVKGLALTLGGPGPKVRETNPDAYRLFLQAQYILRTGRTAETEVQDLLTQALEIDPSYVPAMLSLARVYNRLSYAGGEAYEDMTREIVDRAVTIDPDNAYGHGWLGWIAIFYDGDLETGARENQRAFALDPTHLDFVHGLQQIARIFGNTEEAIILGRYETIRDPVCSRCYAQLASSYLVARQLDLAEEALLTSQTLDAGADPATHLTLGTIDLLRGDPAAALTDFERLPADWPESRLAAALAGHTLGRTSEFDDAIADLRELSDSVRWLAPLYAWVGDKDRAFEALASSRSAGHPPHNFLPVPQDPIYQDLHSDPRWDALLQSRGLAADQLSAIGFRLEIPEVISAVVN